jgi:hypothetical protein
VCVSDFKFVSVNLVLYVCSFYYNTEFILNELNVINRPNNKLPFGELHNVSNTSLIPNPYKSLKNTLSCEKESWKNPDFY